MKLEYIQPPAMNPAKPHPNLVFECERETAIYLHCMVHAYWECELVRFRINDGPWIDMSDSAPVNQAELLFTLHSAKGA